MYVSLKVQGDATETDTSLEDKQPTGSMFTWMLTFQNQDSSNWNSEKMKANQRPARACSVILELPLVVVVLVYQ